MHYVMDVRNIHAHAKGLCRAKKRRGSFTETLQCIFSCVAIQSSMEVVDTRNLPVRTRKPFIEFWPHGVGGIFALLPQQTENEHPTFFWIDVLLAYVIHYGLDMSLGRRNDLTERHADMVANRVVILHGLPDALDVIDISANIILDKSGHCCRIERCTSPRMGHLQFSAPIHHMQIIGAELLAPLRNAMRLVENEILQSVIHGDTAVKSVYKRL